MGLPHNNYWKVGKQLRYSSFVAPPNLIQIIKYLDHVINIAGTTFAIHKYSLRFTEMVIDVSEPTKPHLIIEHTDRQRKLISTPVIHVWERRCSLVHSNNIEIANNC